MRHTISRRVRCGWQKTDEVAPTSAAACRISEVETSIDKVPFGVGQPRGNLLVVILTGGMGSLLPHQKITHEAATADSGFASLPASGGRERDYDCTPFGGKGLCSTRPRLG